MLNCKKQAFLLLALAFFTFVMESSAQVVDNSRELRRPGSDQQRSEDSAAARRDAFRNLNESHRIRQQALEKAVKPNVIKETPEDRAARERMLKPNPEDLAKNKNLLSESNTGIFRLFPDYDCASKGVIRVDNSCDSYLTDAWSYSFRRKKYSDGVFFDIRLKDGNISADSFLSQNLIVELGDIPLENISLTGNGVRFLDSFQPESEISKIEAQTSQIRKGIDAEGYKYLKSVKAKENMTYAARFIAYRAKIKDTDEFYEKH